MFPGNRDTYCPYKTSSHLAFIFEALGSSADWLAPPSGCPWAWPTRNTGTDPGCTFLPISSQGYTQGVGVREERLLLRSFYEGGRGPGVWGLTRTPCACLHVTGNLTLSCTQLPVEGPCCFSRAHCYFSDLLVARFSGRRAFMTSGGHLSWPPWFQSQPVANSQQAMGVFPQQLVSLTLPTRGPESCTGTESQARRTPGDQPDEGSLCAREIMALVPTGSSPWG